MDTAPKKEMDIDFDSDERRFYDMLDDEDDEKEAEKVSDDETEDEKIYESATQDDNLSEEKDDSADLKSDDVNPTEEAIFNQSDEDSN